MTTPGSAASAALSPEDYSASRKHLSRDGECEATAECDAEIYARRLCRVHYNRRLRRGTVEPATRPSETERFWAKVLVGDGCWEWQAARAYGYGKFGTSPSGVVSAHRYAYELLVGPIPEGLQLDHLCRNPPCVRPDHLEPVTAAENLRRAREANGVSPTCRRGHEFTPENTYTAPAGWRTCRICWRAGYERRKAS